MRFVYPARLDRTGPHEIVVSFRDLPECLTSGADASAAVVEAQDALEEAMAGRINRNEVIPRPSTPQTGEHPIAVPTDMAAKAALVLVFRQSGLTRVALAQRLGTDEKAVRRMLDPRHGTAASRLNQALHCLGSELVVEMRALSAA